MCPLFTRPESVPAALTALVVIVVTVLAAMGRDIPNVLTLLATGTGGATLGILNPTKPAAQVAPVEAAPVEAAPVAFPPGVGG